MRVRIRLGSRHKLHRQSRKNQHVALALASLLIPAAVMAYVLAGWELTADLNLTRQVPIVIGVFSHWLVWFAGAVALHAGAIVLNRYGKADTGAKETMDEPDQKLANSRL